MTLSGLSASLCQIPYFNYNTKTYVRQYKIENLFDFCNSVLNGAKYKILFIQVQKQFQEATG